MIPFYLKNRNALTSGAKSATIAMGGGIVMVTYDLDQARVAGSNPVPRSNSGTNGGLDSLKHISYNITAWSRYRVCCPTEGIERHDL